ncbi:uncharacterized protein LOC110230865 [Arabidopsis lyrata subsp. lyrata]|uniref:uncharacterized protein LOC110230865 n=1 Tax=Arabidopsis lyrata subsp. lyrata TaxID=81972 RepID=UPI000A29E064|nr:uncharacterized protein LOC110230865 [Arabidopsis lyrata subsp. lyrata]|eukprot:XP_020890722.1 uncharacterized protein LOC110230865 [Arabidopsis lyrata subsp. lyrata]
MEGNAFLFRVPNSATRNRILAQGLWQIEGQTMFVAKWKPGPTPKKPELSSAPVWLELRNVPYQFFNHDGFEFIAGLVGEPKGLHPSTANMTNLEVAKVFTLIDPRKPLPEAVNVQFASGEICRILVSSPWMPPVCSFCKEVGHNLKHCKLAPIVCSACSSACHSAEECPRGKAKSKKKSTKKKEAVVVPVTSSCSPVVAGAASAHDKGKAIAVQSGAVVQVQKSKESTATSSQWIQVKPKSTKKLGVVDKPSGSRSIPAQVVVPVTSALQNHEGSLSIDTGIEMIQAEQELLESKSLASDSSDVQSSEDGVDPEVDERQFLKMFSQRQQRSSRGKAPKQI